MDRRRSAPKNCRPSGVVNGGRIDLAGLVRGDNEITIADPGVARDMLGLGAPFRDVPFFWSQHYDVTLAYVGHADSWDTIELRGSLAERDAAVVYRRAGRALAVVTVGRDRQSLAIEAALERGDDAEVEALLQQ